MGEDGIKPGWGQIVVALLLTGLATGLLLGTAGEYFGWSPSTTTAGVGAAIGAVGGGMIARRRAAQARQRRD